MLFLFHHDKKVAYMPLKTHVILHILNFTLLTDLLIYFINLQLTPDKKH